MIKAKDLNIGDRVVHCNHGPGTVWAYAQFDDEIFIDFDITPNGWDKILNVSVQCLKKKNNYQLVNK